MKDLMDLNEKELDLEIDNLQVRLQKLRRINLLREQVRIIESGGYSDEKAAQIVRCAVQVVCQAFDVSEEEIYSKRRPAAIAVPRQVVFYVARQKHLSLQAIGNVFGKDHGTVLHGARHIEDKASVEPEFKLTVENIKQALDAQLKLTHA